jgi:hypothetical protein
MTQPTPIEEAQQAFNEMKDLMQDQVMSPRVSIASGLLAGQVAKYGFNPDLHKHWCVQSLALADLLIKTDKEGAAK